MYNYGLTDEQLDKLKEFIIEKFSITDEEVNTIPLPKQVDMWNSYAPILQHNIDTFAKQSTLTESQKDYVDIHSIYLKHLPLHINV